jgi:hypothetical protein
MPSSLRCLAKLVSGFLLIAVTISLLIVPKCLSQMAESKLLAADAASEDQFGWSVAISGNYLIIGAPYDDDDGDNAGSAYIFKRDGATWTQHAKLTGDDTLQIYSFGRSVSIYGDTAVVGTSGNTPSGAAYVFLRDGDSWVQQAKLVGSDIVSGDDFGRSVSIFGDRVVVGARGADSSYNDSGAAYVFKRIEGTWSQEAKLTATDSTTGDWFGYSVSISWDYIAIGSYYNNSGRCAHVFKYSGTEWEAEAELVGADTQSGDGFGISVSLSGNDLIVGAPNDYIDAVGATVGSIYAFSRIDGVWQQVQKLNAAYGVSNGHFGQCVSISGDYCAIGAPRGGVGGAVYIFKRDESIWTQHSILQAPDNWIPDRYGESVGMSNGYVAVGAFADDEIAMDAGAVYSYASHLYGRITTDVTGADDTPVVGATISILGTDLSATTGADGYFEIGEEVVGTYNVKIEKQFFQNILLEDLEMTLGHQIPSQKMTVLNWDVNGDGKKGLEEVVEILQIVTGNSR